MGGLAENADFSSWTRVGYVVIRAFVFCLYAQLGGELWLVGDFAPRGWARGVLGTRAEYVG